MKTGMLKSILLMILCSGCLTSQRGLIVTPISEIREIPWSQEELQRDLVVRDIKSTSQTSHHLIRLKTAEKPHVHKFHDLTVFVLEGKGIIYLGERQVFIKAGDVIQIPRGTVHWAKNLSPSASEVYAIFNPPFDKKDFHPISDR